MMIVMTIMITAAGIFSQMVVATAQLRDVQRENAIAAEAARVVIEEMRNQDFRELFFLYNQDPADDPGGAGTGPGHRFVVDGLNVMPGSADGRHLEIILPALELDAPSQLTGTKWDTRMTTLKGTGGAGIGMIGGSAGGAGGSLSFGGSGGGGSSISIGSNPPPPSSLWELREDYQSAKWGMPRDLNGDSIIDDYDHAYDYYLLPVLIRIEWQGRNGPRTYEVHTMLAEYKG